MLTKSLKRKLLRYAKMSAPYDTGNLRHNAINGKNWNDKNKFTINYSAEDAYYTEFLEEKEFAGGSLTKKNKHKGFITKTYLHLGNQLDNYFKRGFKMPKMKKMQNGEEVNTERRIYTHNRSLDMYKMLRERDGE